MVWPGAGGVWSGAQTPLVRFNTFLTLGLITSRQLRLQHVSATLDAKQLAPSLHLSLTRTAVLFVLYTTSRPIHLTEQMRYIVRGYRHRKGYSKGVFFIISPVWGSNDSLLTKMQVHSNNPNQPKAQKDCIISERSEGKHLEMINYSEKLLLI